MKKLSILLVIALMLFSFAGCSSGEPATSEKPAVNEQPVEEPAEEPTEEPAEEPATSEEPVSGGEAKTFEGTAKGFGGEVKVTVAMDGDDIVDVIAVGDSETNGIGSNAIEQLPAKIVEADSTEVEVVSGATITSNAIIEAVNNALAAQ